MNGTEIYKFKAKDSEIVANPLCLENISKDWSTDKMKKKTRFNRYASDFSVDYDATDVDVIKDIHKYLMKKNDMVSIKIFGFVKKSVFYWINNSVKFNKCNSIGLYFNEESRM